MRALAGNNQGTNANILKRFYEAAILPILDYGSIIFTNLSYTQTKKLQTAQNSALRLILGVHRWTNVTILHNELNIKPLVYRFKTNIAKFIAKVSINSDHALHTTVNQSFIKNREVFDQPTWDLLSVDVLKEVFFENIIPQHPDIYPPWVTPKVHVLIHKSYTSKNTVSPEQARKEAEDHIASMVKGKTAIFYTDGSIADNKVGAGIHSPTLNYNKFFRLNDTASILQAELYAIFIAVTTAVEYTHTYDNFVINTDSAGSILNLKHNISTNNHQLISNIRMVIDQSASTFIVNWVPSHVGIPGNEVADELARKGTLKPKIDDIVPTSLDQLKVLIKRKFQEQWKEDYMDIENNRHNYNAKLPHNNSKQYLALPRHIQKYISKLRVGQKTFQELKQKDTCKICGERPKHLFVHFLATCPALSTLRQDIFQQAPTFHHWDLTNEVQISHNILTTQHKRNYQELIPMLNKHDIYQ